MAYKSITPGADTYVWYVLQVYVAGIITDVIITPVTCCNKSKCLQVKEDVFEQKKKRRHAVSSQYETEMAVVRANAAQKENRAR